MTIVTQNQSNIYKKKCDNSRLFSEQNSEIEILNKQREIYKQSINRIKQKSFDELNPKYFNKTQHENG
jgi:hypothetical protein